MIQPLEAFADAIMQFEGWKLGSRSYVNRNPGNLRAWNPSQERDDHGFIIFGSLLAGYAALLRDLEIKFTGLGVTKLGPQSTVLEFFRQYAPYADGNRPSEYAAFVANWCQHALRRPIAPLSKLMDVWPGCAPAKVGT